MTSELDRITQKYLRRYPISKRTKSWAGRMVHIQTENGVWRINGKGYTYAHKQDAWVLSFEDAQKQVNHCGPEKQAAFIDATTRAVPDVPELVRWKPNLNPQQLNDMIKTTDGEYVRHDQAVTVIAVLKSELYDMSRDRDQALEWRDHDKERAEAADAKLAQIEKQDPVGWLDENQGNINYFHGAKPDSRRLAIPLYTAPVSSDAELRAERDRYKHALDEIAKEFDLTTSRLRLRNIAEAALNPSEARG